MKKKKGKSNKKGALASIWMWTFRSTMALLTAVVSLLLVTSAYSEMVNPNTWMLPSFLGIGFGVLLIAGLLWSLLLLLTRRWRCLLGMLVAWAIVAYPALRYCPLHLSGEQEPLTKTAKGTNIEHIRRIKVLSYNTCLMGHSRLNDRKKSVPVLDVIRASEADMVCLQEFSFTTNKNGYTLESLYGKLNDQYPHHDFTAYSYNRRSGIAIFSKYPIKKVDRIDHKKKGYTAAMYYQIEIDGQTIGVVNMHLRSNKLSKEDRQLYDDMIGHFEADSLGRIRTGMLRSLAIAWKQRANEVDQISEYVRENHPKDMPLLICGDMNDTPVSYSNYTLRGIGVSDTWKETGFGPGITYSEHRFWFRIDHIMHNEGLHALKMQVRRDVKHSDHYPIEATFQLLPE